MGWLFMPSIAPHRTPREYLDAQYTFFDAEARRRILKSAVVKMRTYYAAMEVEEAGVSREVFGLVCLVKYNPRDRNGDAFGYKDIDETMGPYEAECPEAILDLLTDTDNENALNWRSRCREYAARRKSYGTLRHGDRLIFPHPIHFSDKTDHTEFEVCFSPCRPRAIRLRAPNGRLYRISNLKGRQFELRRETT